MRFWDASDIEAPFGKIQFGAEMLENEGRATPMAWDGKNGGDLAGQSVRLRFFLRDAKIYGVNPTK